MQKEDPILLHGPAFEHRTIDVVEPGVGKEFVEMDFQRTVDHQTKCALGVVVDHQADRVVEVVAPQTRERNQKLVAKAVGVLFSHRRKGRAGEESSILAGARGRLSSTKADQNLRELFLRNCQVRMISRTSVVSRNWSGNGANGEASFTIRTAASSRTL